MARCAASQTLYLLLCNYLYGILYIKSQTILPIGSNLDDWITLNEHNIGWNNGDIITTSAASNKDYHGLFDGDIGETLLSRDDIVLETSGTVSMDFTLVFGCAIIDTSDTITVTVGTETNDYYIVDTVGDYPYVTPSGFIINTFNTDAIYNTFCNNSLWYIQSCVTSEAFTKDTSIYIAFKSSFNYQIPYDNDDKYWAVTDIVFNVVSTQSLMDDIDNDVATIIMLIVICAILFILLIVLYRYCRKSKKVRNKKKKHMLKSMKSLSVQLTETTPNNNIKEDQETNTEYEALIQQNKQLKSELSQLQRAIEELRTIEESRIKVSKADINHMESVIPRLRKDIADIEQMNAAKQLEVELELELKEDTVMDTWMVLSSIPNEEDPHMCLVEMNYREFGVVLWNRKKQIIYKYGGRDRWRLSMECTHHLKSKYWIACGHRWNNRVFMYGNLGEMLVFDIERRSVDVVKKLNNIVIEGSECVMMDGTLHIMGGIDAFHMLWNTKANVLKKLRMDIGALNVKQFGLVALKKSKRMLLFGGRLNSNIYQYSLDNCSWMKLKCVLPFKMHSFGYVVTSDQRYIVLFGGIRENGKDMDDIFIWSVGNMIFKRAQVKCPSSGGFRALLMDYSDEYEMILCGMRRESMIKSIGDDILQLIMNWTVTNDIHLIHSKTGRHWRMSMYSIIDAQCI